LSLSIRIFSSFCLTLEPTVEEGFRIFHGWLTLTGIDTAEAKRRGKKAAYNYKNLFREQFWNDNFLPNWLFYSCLQLDVDRDKLLLMKAYSLDLRQRVVHAYEQGEGSISEIASRFGVCSAFVKKMLRQWRATGDLSPLAHGGGKPASLTPRQRQLLKRKVREQSDISLAELQNLLDETEQVQVHVSTISRALSGLGLPLKKRA
jgi:transposase